MELVCNCSRPLHAQGVEEDDKGAISLIRFACERCRWHVGLGGSSMNGDTWVDRLIWTDEALHALERMPPHIRGLVCPQVEEFAKSNGRRIITFELHLQARLREAVTWEPEAEERLSNVPPTVRAMARMELERSAAEGGEARVTVALMDRVKARYFGMGARRNEER
jgi:hypothetical protein